MRWVTPIGLPVTQVWVQIPCGYGPAVSNCNGDCVCPVCHRVSDIESLLEQVCMSASAASHHPRPVPAAPSNLFNPALLSRIVQDCEDRPADGPATHVRKQGR